MTIKVTVPNTSSDSLTFGSANTPTAAQVIGIDSGSSNGQLAFNTTASGTSTERVRIDASGNVGVGTTTPARKLHVKGICAYEAISGSTNYWENYTYTDNTLRWNYNGAGNDEMTLDTSGNLLVGTTSANGKITVVSASSQTAATFYRASSSSGDGVSIWYSDTGGSYSIRGVLRVDGGIANYSANNSNLSDERTKTDIVDAGGYLAKICAIPVRTFKYKDQTDDLLNLGVIAQEVEAVAPELVDVSGFGETPEDGVPLKAIYQTDLQYALMKCIQEQQALITTLTERITALEAK